MHSNSIDAYREERLELSRRAKRIYRIFAHNPGSKFTDRQILGLIEAAEGKRLDMNYARPRLTELRDLGLLEECGRTWDHKTGKKVRTMRMVPRIMQQQDQLSLAM